LSIRHYNDELVAQMTSGKTIKLKQQSPETAQVVMQ
jgi:hypothetical protein